MLPDENFLSDLINCQSITPDDAGACDVIAEYLNITPTIFDQNNTTNRLFELNSHLSHPTKYLLFVGHTDVVPPGPSDQWHTPPFEYNSHDPIIARGIVDMKGAVWAFCRAAKKQAPKLNAKIGILVTSDEEGDGKNGIQTVVPKLTQAGFKADYALVGEPTSIHQVGDCFKHARRGSYTVYATLQGKQGHTAYPQNAWSPSIPLNQLLSDFTHFKSTLPHGHDASIFSLRTPTHTSNVIPDSIRIGINIRYFDFKIIDDCINMLLKHSTSIEKHPGALPYVSQPSTSKSALEQAILQTVNIAAKPSTIGGTSDARFLKPISDEIIEFGLRSQFAHHINEQAPKQDLKNLVLIYENFLLNLLRT